MKLYFNADYLPPLTAEYVAWCDVMGTGRALGSSLHRAANFIFKLHRAFSNALTEVAEGQLVRIYPLMDGMYVTSPRRKPFQRVLRIAFRDLADEFLSTPNFSHRFLVRGGIAYGATIHGADIDEGAFLRGLGTPQEVANRTAFQGSHLDKSRSQLLVGSAMVPAYAAEAKAPPFGFYVDDSALSVPQLLDPTDRGFQTTLWRWWLQNDPSRTIAEQLWASMSTHYLEASQQTVDLGYSKESLDKHRNWATEYFRDFRTNNV